MTEQKYGRYGLIQPAIETIERMDLDNLRSLSDSLDECGEDGTMVALQWSAWNHLLPKLETRWFNGDSRALVEALAICGEHGLPLPNWCACEMVNAFQKIESLEVRKWSDLFPELYKGRRLNDLRREQKLKSPAVQSVLKLREREEPIPILDALADVADEYAISPEKLRSWYYAYLEEYPFTTVITDKASFKFKTGSPVQIVGKTCQHIRWQTDPDTLTD